MTPFKVYRRGRKRNALLRACAVALAAASVLSAPRAGAQAVPKDRVEEVGIDPISFRGPDPRERFKDIKIQQNLGVQVPLDLVFRNERDEEVRLGDLITDKPVVLSLVYYGCPMLCTLVLQGMVSGFDGQPADFQLGRDYTVISVSIDPAETGELASEKKANYLASANLPGAEEHWSFLTGDEESIEALAETVGFRYYYDETAGQYAHDSGVMILTPKGKVSSYYLGIEYIPRNLRTALQAAGANSIGDYLQQPTLLCFMYDPTSGTYGLVIMSVLRLGGILTVLLIAAFWLVNYLRGRRAVDTADYTSSTRPPSPAGLSGSV
ncbi:MAG: SCO family protein [Candidatus Hydrogenedentes bacterium]|nr:SCO family protein [Candidatus Hydrogenedentota bacterium]